MPRILLKMPSAAPSTWTLETMSPFVSLTDQLSTSTLPFGGKENENQCEGAGCIHAVNHI